MNFHSLVSNHTTWHGFYSGWRWVINSVCITENIDGTATVKFYRADGSLLAYDTWQSPSVAYSRFAKRLGVDNVECYNFTPSRIPSYTYAKEVRARWGWNTPNIKTPFRSH